MSNEEPTMILDGSSAQPDDLPDFASFAAPRASNPDLDMILDIPVRLSMEVGNTQISIRNLLQLRCHIIARFCQAIVCRGIGDNVIFKVVN